MKGILLTVAWLGISLGLYGGLVALEFYWNFPDWQPRLDTRAIGLLLWIGLMLLATWFLGRVGRDRTTRAVALVMCCAMLVLAIYVLSPEPVKPGLLGRNVASPLWYRMGRLVVLALPGIFWAIWLGRGARLR